MQVMNASEEARENFYRLLDDAAADHEPILNYRPTLITGPRSNAILVGENDWQAIQETLHLLTIPGMRDSIVEGIAVATDQCEAEPGW